ncbi:MAG: pectate lyase [Sphingomonas hengshuiensis]|uniref:Pectate lyase n=1 Tax=Sphingomonas hengshuiensis TaxID=1609977 RepID=A0A2W4Z6R9_9SPHN|nr:MAG: pectate lyase [Sphingomonas hengshuiensis]
MVVASLAAAVASAPAAAQVVAFPGAEGAGRFAAGGRGGQVIRVTTLADAGPGSLRAAIDATGPRTIVFDVAGTIALRSPLVIRNDRITIAGQTAPGDGITLRDQTLQIAASDVIVRYIRSRLGAASRTQGDAIWISGGTRIILDHVSASWSVDETLSASASYRDAASSIGDLTVQWSMITDSLRRAGHVKGEHGYGSLVRGGRGSRMSFHHNLWANHAARMPRPGNYARFDADPRGADFDFRNNVFYNWGGGRSGYNADTDSIARYNFVANTYLPGPDSKGRIAFAESNRHARAWFAGNSMDGQVPSDPWSLVSGETGGAYRLAAPVDMPGIVAEPAGVAAQRVLAGAGASKVRDPVDLAVVDGVRRRTGRQIDTEADAGGWPVLRGGTPARDSDGDGMADAWERANGLDPRRADGNAVRPDGRTSLEAYLDFLAQA